MARKSPRSTTGAAADDGGDKVAFVTVGTTRFDALVQVGKRASQPTPNERDCFPPDRSPRPYTHVRPIPPHTIMRRPPPPRRRSPRCAPGASRAWCCRSGRAPNRARAARRTAPSSRHRPRPPRPPPRRRRPRGRGAGGCRRRAATVERAGSGGTSGWRWSGIGTRTASVRTWRQRTSSSATRVRVVCVRAWESA